MISHSIQDIYAQYHVPPHLQQHMYDVAGVCTSICTHRDNSLSPLPENDLITASLIHDIGNIVKFTRDPALDYLFDISDHPISYRQSIQTSMINTYGSDDHEANILIAREIGVSDNVIELIDAIGFEQLPRLLEGTHIAKLLINYCDLRAGPNGIMSAEERLLDAGKRYKKSARVEQLKDSVSLVDQVESLLFRSCNNIIPTQMTDQTIVDMVPSLKAYNIFSSNSSGA